LQDEAQGDAEHRAQTYGHAQADGKGKIFQHGREATPLGSEIPLRVQDGEGGLGGKQARFHMQAMLNGEILRHIYVIVLCKRPWFG
jgi:hypothetical protein